MVEKTILFLDFTKYSGSINGLFAEIKYLNEQGGYRSVVVSQTGSVAEAESKKLDFRYYAISSKYIYPAYDPQPNYNFFQYLYHYFAVLYSLFKISLVTRPDLIHCNHYQYAHYATVLGFLLRKPTIVHLKDVLPVRLKIQRILLKFNPTVKFIAVSNYVKKLFSERERLNPSKIVVVYDGLNTEIFKSIPDKGAKKKAQVKRKEIIMMTRLDPERQIEDFIDCAAIVADKYAHIEFRHFGLVRSDLNRDYYKSLISRLKALKLGNRFSFHPFEFDQKKVADIQRQSYINIITARNFALPNIAIESMMVGTLVILPASSGNLEVVQDSTLGGLVYSDSPKEYADVIEKYLTNSKLYEKTCKKANALAISKFGYKINYKKIVSLYNSILSR